MPKPKRASPAPARTAARISAARPHERLAAVRHTLKDEVYARVADALMSGEFAPGERLTVRQVAALTQTSVMPVREAFRRLTSEGALEPMSSGATRVPKIDAGEFEEITTLRLSVEGLAARLAAERISVEEIDDLEAANARVLAAVRRRDGHAEARANEAFHFIIYRAARSRILLQIIEGLWLRIGPVLITLFDDLNATQPGRLAGTKYHSRLITALRGGDGAEAQSAIQEDLGHAAKFYVRRLKQLGAAAAQD